MTLYSLNSNICWLGAGLRAETVTLLLGHLSPPGMIMASSSNLAEANFPSYVGWQRIISAPGLSDLATKALRASDNSTPYEILGYGLESTSPPEELVDIVASTAAAKAIADTYHRQFMMAPGYQLMEDNEGLYDDMSALSDWWLFQTQQIQKDYLPGKDYRDEVERVIGLIRAGNADIPIAGQILIPPDETPDPDKWVEYYRWVNDLLDIAYIGAYLVWDYYTDEDIQACIESIFDQVYARWI